MAGCSQTLGQIVATQNCWLKAATRKIRVQKSHENSLVKTVVVRKSVLRREKLNLMSVKIKLHYYQYLVTSQLKHLKELKHQLKLALRD